MISKKVITQNQARFLLMRLVGVPVKINRIASNTDISENYRYIIGKVFKLHEFRASTSGTYDFSLTLDSATLGLFIKEMSFSSANKTLVENSIDLLVNEMKLSYRQYANIKNNLNYY